MKRIMMSLAFAALFIISARGQGFLNLNFESAYNLPGNPGDGELISATNALPDWTVFAGEDLSEVYYYSNFFGGAGTVALMGGSLALSGDYSVELETASSISQTGMVPINAESLQFEANGPSGNLQLTLGGQSLSFSLLSEGPNYDVYGANIPSDMDGQMETLTFGLEGPAQSTLDDIQFISVPEPSECALLGLGAILFGLYHRRCSLLTFRRGASRLLQKLHPTPAVK